MELQRDAGIRVESFRNHSYSYCAHSLEGHSCIRVYAIVVPRLPGEQGLFGKASPFVLIIVARKSGLSRSGSSPVP